MANTTAAPHHGHSHDHRRNVNLDDGLEVRHLHRGNDEVPVTEDHRRARAAEHRRRAQEARDGERLHGHAPLRRHGKRLQDDRGGPAADAQRHEKRTNGGQRPAYGRPIHDHAEFRKGERDERSRAERIRCRRPKRQRDGNQDRRQTRVESEKLDPGRRGTRARA
jgi:hypothetical protein